MAINISKLTKHNKAIVIAGVTASGKSSLALKIAEKIQASIINSDCVQLYRDLKILSDRPSFSKEQDNKLYGYKQAEENGSLASWEKKAREAFNLTIKDKFFPIFVGGTGMYINALFKKVAAIPTIPNEIKMETTGKLTSDRKGFWQELCLLDPKVENYLHYNDTQRILRAANVILATGKSIFDWHKQESTTASLLSHNNSQLVIIMPLDKHALQNKASVRIKQMLKQGAIDEVKHLMEKGSIAPTLKKAIGVSEITAYLKGEVSFDEMETHLNYSTFHYMKKQYTWFRKTAKENKCIVID